MEVVEVSLDSDTENESLRSVIVVSDLPRVPRAEEPFLKEENDARPFLKLWPKLLEEEV
jgi:hypothetical protein